MVYLVLPRSNLTVLVQNYSAKLLAVDMSGGQLLFVAFDTDIAFMEGASEEEVFVRWKCLFISEQYTQAGAQVLFSSLNWSDSSLKMVAR